MKREDISYSVSFILLILVCLTGATGYIQSSQDFRKFVPHRWFAYSTLVLAAIHLALNAGKSFRYIRRKLRRKK